jgi:hypothetical protein
MSEIYSIYHIPGVKIGCTKRSVKERVRMQKYSNFQILEEHDDEFIAGNRELELQIQFGYTKDCIPYYKGKYSENGKKRGKECVKTGWINEFQKLGNIASTESLKKIVLQYDLNGNFIKEWDCGVKELSRKYGYNVSGVCTEKKNNKTIGGFQWRYKTSDDYPTKIEKFENKSFQKVIQKDLEGNIIKVWDNQTQAAKSLECSTALISNVCRGNRKTAKGFIWERFVS